MNINLTISFDKDSKEFLSQLVRYELKKEDAPAPKKPTEIPKKAAAAPAPVKPAEPNTTHTLESVRAIAHTKKKDDVRALLTEYGVEGLTKLLPAQYDAFMVSLNKLS